MRIAQIAPLVESVPPRLYGGTERIVSYLTEELVAQGHDVTLFASGDSRTSARLVRCCPEALRLTDVKDPLPYHLLMLEDVRCLAPSFDVLHFHTDQVHYPIFRSVLARTVTTLHGRLDYPGLAPLYQRFSDAPLASISWSQRKPLPESLNWAACIHHGLPLDMLRPLPSPTGAYLAFLGRISPEKRPDRAIEIAARAGRELVIAAKVDPVDRDYWSYHIEPMVRRHPNVRYVGEIHEWEKADFLGNAAALLFPIDWPEPFGLVMIEAMACGTPVIAWNNGSVAEVIDPGVTGFVVDSIADAAALVDSALCLDRPRIRATFEQRFTADRMATDYVRLYRSLAGASDSPARLAARPAADLQAAE